ncbi:unnamed protein product [Cladocopium goreaui]|uniref:Uncharacterized protein n=1 Tax=Cladocopium goreaui TaxID=2562237 RepID=A0A9P1DIH2_9DINO|nr:unnamed protein product [Cladocopium goreaui]
MPRWPRSIWRARRVLFVLSDVWIHLRCTDITDRVASGVCPAASLRTSAWLSEHLWQGRGTASVTELWDGRSCEDTVKHILLWRCKHEPCSAGASFTEDIAAEIFVVCLCLEKGNETSHAGLRQLQLFEDLARKNIDLEEIVVSQDLCDQPTHERRQKILFCLEQQLSIWFKQNSASQHITAD